MKKILVLNGPNLNLLGTREPELYGEESLVKINQSLEGRARRAGFMLSAMQSNSEAVLIEQLHQASADKIDYCIFNPAAFTHTSIALRDALLAVQIPFVEVHISNIFAREDFRSYSYFSDIAMGVISGFGTKGYMLALEAIIHSN